MSSLVPNYDSSSDDEEEEQQTNEPISIKRKLQIPVILPSTNSSSQFSITHTNANKKSKHSSSLFDSLPLPKTAKSHTVLGSGSSSGKTGITLSNTPKTTTVSTTVSTTYQNEHMENIKEEQEKEDFFTLPSPTNHHQVTEIPSRPLKVRATVNELDDFVSASAMYAYPNVQMSGEIYSESHHQQDYRAFLPQDVDLHKLQLLGHKSSEGPIQFIEVNQYQNLQQEKQSDLAHYGTDEKVIQARGSHILPAKDTRKRHTMMSLMVKAKEEAALMDEQRAKGKAERKLAKAKYGF